MRSALIVLTLLMAPQGRSPAAEALALLPEECVLSTPVRTQTLLVQRRAGGEFRQQVTQKVVWSSSNPEVATVAGGVVKPVADGEAQITASVGEMTATSRVVVKGINQPVALSFRSDVEPMLAKLGCNSGACHGALAGKGGFRLSLRGYDPAADHFNMVKQDRGRRVELADPGRSLVLAKPSGAIAHKGGVRFTTAHPSIAFWPTGSPPVRHRRPTPTRASSGSRSCRPARFMRSARRSKSSFAPTAATAAPKT